MSQKRLERIKTLEERIKKNQALLEGMQPTQLGRDKLVASIDLDSVMFDFLRGLEESDSLQFSKAFDDVFASSDLPHLDGMYSRALSRE